MIHVKALNILKNNENESYLNQVISTKDKEFYKSKIFNTEYILNIYNPIYLDLIYMRIGVEGGKLLVKGLKASNYNLRRLNIRSNNIGVEGIKEIANFLESKKCFNLKELNLGDNRIGDEGIKSIATVLESGK